MKKLFLTVILAATALTGPVFTQTSGLGVGVILGEPTGLSAKKFISQSVAVDGALAWSFSDGEALHLHADLLYHSFDQLNIDFGHLALYYGPGARLAIGNHLWLGARFPVGISFTKSDQIFEGFFELAPTFDIAPRTDFKLFAGIGLRYYF